MVDIFRIWAMLPAHNRLSHILEKNEVPDTLNGLLVKHEDATIIVPDSTLYVYVHTVHVHIIRYKATLGHSL